MKRKQHTIYHKHQRRAISSVLTAHDRWRGHMRVILLLAAALTIALVTYPAMAKRYKTIQYSNGTGFFVSTTGYLVTNAHVVDRCKWAQISGPNMVGRARILARDTEHDMALLVSNMAPSSAAAFRPLAKKLTKGDRVVAVGHPLGKSLTAHPSELIANNGPMGERQWLQFANSIYQGNSGGPLLDRSGQVIGMITAKSTLYRFDPASNTNEVVGNSDIAIQPYILESFLRENRVPLLYSKNAPTLSERGIKRRAEGYVVQIKCAIES